MECDKSGVTRSHVFRGSVKVQSRSSYGAAEGQGMVLGENESAVIESGRLRPIQVAREDTPEGVLERFCASHAPSHADQAFQHGHRA